MDFFWEKAGWEAQDPHLVKLAEMPFQRPFPFIPEKAGLYIIRGPRQVGKTCWLKSILKQYASTHLCFYLSCEEITHFKELSELLKSLKNRDIVLLDEINYVPDWDRAVKHAIDSGYPKLLVITGSHSHDLKNGADRMPGRFGHGGEYALLPMDFFEFEQALETMSLKQANRVQNLSLYFKIGGFPHALGSKTSNHTLSKQALDTYWRWLAGDFVKLGKSERLLSDILIQLAMTLQSSISFTQLAQRAGIGSHNTLIDYLDLLESCFALRTLHSIDIDTGSFRPKKNRKFYFTDPLLYHLAIDQSGMKKTQDYAAALAEMVAHEHLARRYKRFGYHANQKGEVDFVLPSHWGIEVKWSPAAINLSSAYLQLSVPDKIVWTQQNFLEEWPMS